jgi:Rieske Fe-S protein
VNEPEPLVEELVSNAIPAETATDTTVTVGRRGFLQMSSAIAAAVTADDIAVLDIGVPIRVDFVQTQDDAWITNRALNGVWLYTEDGAKFKAYNGHCTHLGCGYMLAKDGKSFVCPCHRGQFDIKTGAVLGGPPPRPLDELEAEVRDGSVFVKYQDFRLGVAERVPV